MWNNFQSISFIEIKFGTFNIKFHLSRLHLSSTRPRSNHRLSWVCTVVCNSFSLPIASLFTKAPKESIAFITAWICRKKQPHFRFYPMFEFLNWRLWGYKANDFQNPVNIKHHLFTKESNLTWKVWSEGNIVSDRRHCKLK